MNIPVTEVSDSQVAQLLEMEEGHFIELKSIGVTPASLTKTVSAFANTGGGEVYVGLDESVGLLGKVRKWRGFNDQESANGVLQAIESLSPLGNHYTAEFIKHGNSKGLILHVTIFKTREIIVATNGEAYVRRGAQKLPVDSGEGLQRLRYDKGLNSFEDERISVAQSEITNSSVVIDFLLSVVPTAEPDIWLRKQQVIVDDLPTVAGIMLFSEQPQAILPKRSAIKLYRYRTKAEGERDYLVGDPITIEGSVYELVHAAVDKCKELIEGIQKLGEHGLEQVRYPEEALHEIITNAVLHRDYSIASDVQVRIFDNRVEIESPGRFPGHVTPDNVLHEQFARNPKLVRLINKFPNPPNKDVGEGLNTAFESMDKLRLKPPLIEERENTLLVVLRHESLGSPEQLVMAYLERHPEITNSIGRELTGIKSENTMKEVFYKLRDRKLLEQVPEKLGRNAAWRKRQ